MSYFALRTEPGRLPIVRQLLRRQGHTCYLPAEIRMNHRRRKRIVVPMMPYLFIKAPAAEVQALWMQQVKGTRYVRDFIRMGGEPAPVYDDALDLLRRAIKEDREKVEAFRLRNFIRAGTKIRHQNGRVGTVVWTKKRRLKWETILFGREVIVESTIDQIEIAA